MSNEMCLGTYRIHSVLKVPQRANVTAPNGETVSGTLDMLEIVLAGDPQHGSKVVRYYGKKADEAALLFKTDADIELWVREPQAKEAAKAA